MAGYRLTGFGADRRIGAGRSLTVGAAETAQIVRFGADGRSASIVLRSRSAVLRSRSALGVQRHRRHTEPAG